MQSTPPYVPTHARPRGGEVVRHRVRTRFTGRGRFVVPAAVLLLGLPVAAVSAAVNGGGSGPDTTLAVTAGQEARADSADRADRAQRESSPTPSAAATTTAPAQANAQAQAKAAPEATKTQAATPAPKATTAKPKATPAWVTPMPGGEITSCFGQRWGVLHAGIDLAADEGTPIHAAAAGTVLAAGWIYSGYGISVMIDHGGGVQTHYAHQSRTIVQPGQKVKAGQVIGYEGSTGDSTGPHLHFEVHMGLWNQINPAPFMRARGVNLGC
ncbi:M23 family metallopeptidase [Phytohabitans sp. ZYX-F-186]|uniref:M23 family metallopeptidase n=1 Tax=Phytohabitans maris TaxID=3071409 RepID=A0ABU0Z892_9ACTN|nr:M23 family metallopeptidase [Phytohabitans sp. ZYX-F-186]MDQ7903269.1 M23 family metallopeptidase [Phytohabitans sp. ZYX-F-186]